MANSKSSREEMLEEVRVAIRNILVGGQSYKIGSRTLTRADLGKLLDYEEELEAECAESVPGLLDDTFVAFFSGR